MPEILYNYKPYDLPIIGSFRIDTNVFKLPGGWLTKEEDYKIIGETDDSYVFKIIASEHGEWIGDKVIRKRYNLPIGIHKTRLIKWQPTQLELF